MDRKSAPSKLKIFQSKRILLNLAHVNQRLKTTTKTERTLKPKFIMRVNFKPKKINTKFKFDSI